MLKNNMPAELAELANTRSPIIIFGCLEMGLLTQQLLEKLQKQVSCFCDNDQHKWGSVIEDIAVLSPQQAAQEFPTAKVLISTYNICHAAQIKVQLTALGFTDIVENTALPAWYHLCGVWEPPVVLRENQLVARLVNLSVTDHCTLNCAECTQLTALAQNPTERRVDTILAELHRFLEVVDVIETLCLLGGEAFLHEGFGELCEQALKMDAIKRIIIITNGTLLPAESWLSVLANPKIEIQISDYGNLSVCKEEILALCKQNHIRCVALSHIGNWVSYGDVSPHNRGAERNRDLCCLCRVPYNCNHILNGKYYLCLRQAFGSAYGLIPETKDDYFDFMSPDMTIEEKRHGFLEYAKSYRAFSACDYCTDSIKKVPKAVQAPRK